ncbi:antitoxin [Candidatus Poriferisodalis sp.]|uniref:antitoxin n=1 Tax=Candidatus Poriferisodalis sp. TaxID=3101277 RepID=UPI003B026A57
MRTTIDLPPDLHAVARELAHQQRKSLSQVVTELIRLGLDPVENSTLPSPTSSRAGGLPTICIGRSVTSEDVRSLDDE